MNLIKDTFSKAYLPNIKTIETVSGSFSKHQLHILRKYIELIYHTTASRVINCESHLPQENYIDYSLADMKERKTTLSELQIFWKIFLEMFFETFNKPKVPIEVLDMLSFEDIQKIRQPLLDADFAKNYDALIAKSIRAVSQDEPDKLLFNIEELLSIKKNLNFFFREVFSKELDSFEKAKNVTASRKIKNNFNVGLGISPLGNLSGLIENKPGNVSFLFNSAQGFNNYRAVNSYGTVLEAKQNELNRIVGRIDLKERKLLSDAVRLLIASVNDKMII